MALELTRQVYYIVGFRQGGTSNRLEMIARNKLIDSITKRTVKEINFIVRNRSSAIVAEERLRKKAIPHPPKDHAHYTPSNHQTHPPSPPWISTSIKSQAKQARREVHRQSRIPHSSLLATSHSHIHTEYATRYRPTKLRILYHHSFVLPVRSCHVEKSCVRASQLWSLVDSW